MSNPSRGFKKLNLEITNKCNFRCCYCPEAVSNREKIHMDFRLAKRIIDEASQEKLFSCISFTSLGEPFLHPRLLDIVKAAKDNNLLTFLATNGSLCTKQLILKLMQAELDFLVLGINASRKEEFQWRHSDIPFADYLSRIKEVIKAFILSSHSKLILSYVFTPRKKNLCRLSILEEENKIHALVRFWKDLIRENGGDIVRDQKDIPSQDENSLNFFEGNLSKISKNIYIRFKRLNFRLFPGAFKKEQVVKKFKKATCANIENELTILSNGDVTFCCQRDFDAALQLGNIKNTKLRDIYYGKKASRLKYSNAMGYLIAPYCQKCDKKADF